MSQIASPALLRRKSDSMTFSVIFKDKSKVGLADRLVSYSNPAFSQSARRAAMAVLEFSSEPMPGFLLILRCDGHADVWNSHGQFHVYHTRDIP